MNCNPYLIERLENNGYDAVDIMTNYQYCGTYDDKYFDRYFKGIEKDKPAVETHCICGVKIMKNYYIINKNDKVEGNILVLGSTCIKSFFGDNCKKCKDCECYIKFTERQENKQKVERKRCKSCLKSYKKAKKEKKKKKENEKIMKIMEENRRRQEEENKRKEQFYKTHCKVCDKYINSTKYGNRCYECNMNNGPYTCSKCNKKMWKNFQYCFSCKFFYKNS